MVVFCYLLSDKGFHAGFNLRRSTVRVQRAASLYDQRIGLRDHWGTRRLLLSEYDQSEDITAVVCVYTALSFKRSSTVLSTAQHNLKTVPSSITTQVCMLHLTTAHSLLDSIFLEKLLSNQCNNFRVNVIRRCWDVKIYSFSFLCTYSTKRIWIIKFDLRIINPIASKPPMKCFEIKYLVQCDNNG